MIIILKEKAIEKLGWNLRDIWGFTRGDETYSMKETREMGLAEKKERKKVEYDTKNIIFAACNNPRIHVVYQKAQIWATFVTDSSNDEFEV